VDGDDNLYLVEQGSATIHVLDKQGKKLKAIRHPELIRPADIVIDRQRSKLYVADPSSKKAEQHTVKFFDLDGNLMGQIGRGKGEAPGQLYFPTYLALDRWGNLYISSTMNARVDVFSPDGEHLKSIGERGDAFGMFDKPKGIALDRFDNIYVADSNWGNVQIFNQKGQVLLYFGGRGSYSGLLKNPTGIDIDRNNRIYVADLLNDRVSVYQLVNTTAGDSLSPLPSTQGVSPGTFQSEGSASMPVPGFSQSQEMLKGGESR
jgi:sugar lactone lactonase YvrE